MSPITGVETSVASGTPATNLQSPSARAVEEMDARHLKTKGPAPQGNSTGLTKSEENANLGIADCNAALEHGLCISTGQAGVIWKTDQAKVAPDEAVQQGKESLAPPSSGMTKLTRDDGPTGDNPDPGAASLKSHSDMDIDNCEDVADGAGPKDDFQDPSGDKKTGKDSDFRKEHQKTVASAGAHLASSGVSTLNPETLKFNKLPSDSSQSSSEPAAKKPRTEKYSRELFQSAQAPTSSQSGLPIQDSQASLGPLHSIPVKIESHKKSPSETNSKAPTEPTTTPAPSASELNENYKVEEKSLKVPEMFQKAISYEVLFRNPNNMLAQLDKLQMKTVHLLLKDSGFYISKEIHDFMIQIIGWNVNNYLNHGGYKINSFKIQNASANLDEINQSVNNKGFSSVIRSCPRLLQLDGGDPFFKKDVVNFDNIAKLGIFKDERNTDGSWKCLIGLMIRSSTSTNEIYHDKETGFKLAVNCIRSLLWHCLNPIDTNTCIQPETQTTSSQNGIEEALKFVILKCREFSSKFSSTPAIKGNGLHFLKKRIWETLTSILLTHCSANSPHCERYWTRQNNGNQRKNSMKKEVELKDLYRKIGLDVTTENWGRKRQAALGSASIFLAFGPVGWWTGFTNTNNYNLKSVYGLINLARHKHTYLKKNPSRCNNSNPFNSNHPWSNVQALVYSCLEDLKYHLDKSEQEKDIDWENVMEVWGRKLSEEAISQAALIDIISEISFPGKSLSWEGVEAKSIVLHNNNFTEDLRHKWKEFMRLGMELSPIETPEEDAAKETSTKT
ncbi:uncharacterized protein PGTG_03353 [Puccinia graminis f. sp. tritici CRL 75-36-700-3]|uniref:Golgi to ER traffic-protein n=1 Tax=Puccinia graminis f. sp. tritici (strain CRL 75-36-700-3 / race SCCL) TaxID=418459 RepID=E3JZC2_PUCGT|nr:uncharacterized protein PGTG_03353 [Puccinia graminis f. sp. tritici CRL 75-36-700-3]EFP77397.1 hypothetical protein PGTG_03353 [Puccinia graminis f. sp. tritici CRL 75-36-700-3]